MKKVRNNFKLTPEWDKHLKALSKTLPPFQRAEDGKELFRKRTQVVTGKQLLDAGHTEVAGKSIDSTKKYVQAFKEPIMVPHLVNLRAVYQVDGKKGVDGSVKYFTDLETKVKEEKEKAKEPAE